jgi:hypothetical protein
MVYNHDKQYESNMYFVENPEGLVAESQNIDNHSNMDTEDNKDIYSCAMCIDLSMFRRFSY